MFQNKKVFQDRRKKTFKYFSNAKIRYHGNTQFETFNFFNILEDESTVSDNDLEKNECRKVKERVSKLSKNDLHYGFHSKRKSKVEDKTHSQDSRKLEENNCCIVTSKNQKDKDMCDLITPKRCLKKCRYCNFKKRSCFFNPHSCKAKQLRCYSCLKMGHFPQSLNCKARKFVNRMIREEKNKIIDTLNNVNKRSENCMTLSSKRYPQAIQIASSFTAIPIPYLPIRWQ